MEGTDVLPLLGLVEVGQGEQYWCDDETYTNDNMAYMLVSIQRLYIFFEQHSHDADRYHRNDDVEGIASFVVPLKT